MIHQLAITIPTDVTRCPLCGDAGGRFRRRGYYVKCPTCKVAFRPQHACDAKLDEYWQEEFWSTEEIEKRKRREPVFRQAFDVLRHHKPEAGSVLDIGCGIGTFLAVCREGGWDVTGVEPSSTACEVAKSEYGLELINAPFSPSLFEGKKFDAVFAAQVLHHLPDPAAFAADIHRVLADDGVLILRTPNSIALEPSLLMQGFLGRDNGFFCGPALYVFHPDTLSMPRSSPFLNERFIAHADVSSEVEFVIRIGGGCRLACEKKDKQTAQQLCRGVFLLHLLLLLLCISRF